MLSTSRVVDVNELALLPPPTPSSVAESSANFVALLRAQPVDALLWLPFASRFSMAATLLLWANRRASSADLGAMINFGLARVLTPSCDPSIVAKSPSSSRFINGRSFCLGVFKAFSLAHTAERQQNLCFWGFEISFCVIN